MAVKRIPKICVICGDDYDGTPSQKYCQKCGKDPNKAKVRCEISQRMIIWHMGILDEHKTKICKNCHAEFITYSDTSFCSKNCRIQYKIANATCTYCGTNLLSVGIKHYSDNGGVKFCSNICHDKWVKERRAKYQSALPVKICPHCGKEFRTKDKIFCSNDCYIAAKKAGWKPELYRKINKQCAHCNKTFETKSATPDKYCPECRKQIFAAKKKRNDELKKAEKEKKHKLEIEKNGLCFYCKTNYTNCVKMKSNFKEIPDGAEILNNKIISCPSYRD